jgi:predicted RNA-binding Zn-ribbon protein involved in translation (DUF1610 family)
MELKPAICPICGGNLSIPEDKTVVKCMYCGNDIIVREAIEKAVGPTIENYLVLARSAISSRNYKEAYDYYTKALELDLKTYEAWLGRAEVIAARWRALFDGKFRLPEVITEIENAIKFAPPGKEEEIKIKGAQLINQITVALFEHTLHYPISYQGWYEPIVRALEVAHSYSPHDKTIIDNIIYICKELIEGVKYSYYDIDGNIGHGLFRPPSSLKSLLKSKMDEYIEKRRALDPSYQPPKIEEKTECFIVTATLGNYNHPYVILLRRFRDEWLSKNVIGQIFIEKYYHYSPFFASVIQGRKKLRWMSYTFIVKPSVWLASRLLRKKRKEQ